MKLKEAICIGITTQTQNLPLINCKNINGLLSSAGITADGELLSIDIDGLDYWVCKTNDVISPHIIICEYNSIVGSKAAVSVPYLPEFDRSIAHYANLYAGASIETLVQLGKSIQYKLVASDSGGNSSFFVRNECPNGLRKHSSKESYVRVQVLESRDAEGDLSYLPIGVGMRVN